jgi:hypothetical protein
MGATLATLALSACGPVAHRGMPEPIAEWPERKLTFIRGPLPNQVRTLRTDHGQVVLLVDAQLPADVTVIGLQLDKEQGSLRVQTAQGVLDLLVLADGRVRDPRTALANVRGRVM